MKPTLFPYAIFLAALFLVRPWGDFPLNDDWVYARVTHRFADTGQLVIDVGATASVLGQAITVAPLVKLFGHSHLVLRASTLALALLGLFLVGRLLQLAGVRRNLAVAVQALLALNPFYFYLANTFMTELHGWVPALLGAWLYFRGRARADATDPQGPMLLFGPTIAAAAITGATYWTRQLCALTFFALVGATVLRALYCGERSRLWRALPALLAGVAVFTAVVGGYFAVARWAGVGALRPEFQQPLEAAAAIDLWVLGVGAVTFLTYATAFFAPLLLGFRWSSQGKRPLTVAAACLAAAGALGWLGLQRYGISQMGPPDPFHKAFPFGGNVLFNAGLGPVTLTDVYVFDLSRPHWPLGPWQVVGAVLLAAGALWAPAVLRAAGLRRETGSMRGEVAAFGLLLAVGSVAVALQVFKWQTFDRYFLPGFIGLALALPALLEVEAPFSAVRRWAAWAAAVPVAAFTVAGVHDHFRWNEVRWKWFAEARALGAAPSNIEGGYEVAGWTAVDDVLAKRLPRGCIGDCQCSRGWYCQDASYHIGMNLLPGYALLRSEQPATWLARGPPVILARRAPAPELVRSVKDRHWASVGAPPPGFQKELSFRVLATAGEGTRPLYACEQGAVSSDARCGVANAEPRIPVAHLLAQPVAGSRGLFLCRVGQSDDRFISADKGCEGQGAGELLGYVLP